jgi:multiple sugar transport system substrate-binding protein
MSNRTSGMTRRRFLASTAAVGTATLIGPSRRHASAQGAKPTITFWNGLTGADGKVMGELAGQFTKETGIQVELQMIEWPNLYAKLQVSTPAGEGPDVALIHTVEVPHFASDGILDPIDDRMLAGKGFRGEDYLPSPRNGGT